MRGDLKVPKPTKLSELVWSEPYYWNVLASDEQNWSEPQLHEQSWIIKSTQLKRNWPQVSQPSCAELVNSPRRWHWVQPAGRRHTPCQVQAACSRSCCGGGQIPLWSWRAAAWSRLWCRASSGPAEPADGVNDALGSPPATADWCKGVFVYFSF